MSKFFGANGRNAQRKQAEEEQKLQVEEVSPQTDTDEIRLSEALPGRKLCLVEMV